ncbi:hypothetical protein N8483_03790 [Synechococcus sp. AH-601-O20]|nr:hypothetical protein [Synechococcus sp. AH-601-O20]
MNHATMILLKSDHPLARLQWEAPHSAPPAAFFLACESNVKAHVVGLDLDAT